jgi:hypothetical protein
MAHADDAALIALLAEDAARGDIDPLVACFRQRYGRRRAHAILVQAAELLARAARQLAAPADPLLADLAEASDPSVQPATDDNPQR